MNEPQVMPDEETEPIASVDDTCVDVMKSGKVAIYKDYTKTDKYKRLQR